MKKSLFLSLIGIILALFFVSCDKEAQYNITLSEEKLVFAPEDSVKTITIDVAKGGFSISPENNGVVAWDIKANLVEFRKLPLDSTKSVTLTISNKHKSVELFVEVKVEPKAPEGGDQPGEGGNDKEEEKPEKPENPSDDEGGKDTIPQKPENPNTPGSDEGGKDTIPSEGGVDEGGEEAGDKGDSTQTVEISLELEKSEIVFSEPKAQSVKVTTSPNGTKFSVKASKEGVVSYTITETGLEITPLKDLKEKTEVVLSLSAGEISKDLKITVDYNVTITLNPKEITFEYTNRDPEFVTVSLNPSSFDYSVSVEDESIATASKASRGISIKPKTGLSQTSTTYVNISSGFSTEKIKVTVMVYTTKPDPEQPIDPDPQQPDPGQEPELEPGVELIWAPGVSFTKGWHDANKPFLNGIHTNSCHQATTANLVAWWLDRYVETSWSQSHPLQSNQPRTAQAIFEQINGGKSCDAGTAVDDYKNYFAYNISNDYLKNLSKYSPMAEYMGGGAWTSFAQSGGGFTSMAGSGKNDFMAAVESLRQGPIALGINWHGNATSGGHNITMWGAEVKNGVCIAVYLTDSDNMANVDGIKRYTVEEKTGGSSGKYIHLYDFDKTGLGNPFDRIFHAFTVFAPED